MMSPGDVVHPKLKPLLAAAADQPSLADMTPTEARAFIAARTVARPKGPEIAHVANFTVPGVGGDIPVRLYRPITPRGVVVAAHGGGWMMGSLDSFDATCRYLAQASGQAILSVDYRLAPEHPFPAALDDVWSATRWAAAHSAELGVETRRLAILGESAGGNLAAATCLLAREAGLNAIRLQVLVYPPVDARLSISSLQQFSAGYLQTARDVHHAFRIYGLGSSVSAQDWRISPLLATSHAGLPSALLISAGCDGVRDDSFSYTQALLNARVNAIHVCYPGMIHTFFGMRGLVPDAEHAQTMAANAIREAIG
jgi:acetyl esterase